MNDVKKQFLDYLRGVYGADSTVMSQPMPPIETGPNYPAFDKSMAGGLDIFSRMNQMEQSMGGFSRLENRRPQIGGARGELQSAQDILLGG
jgi:hypothetical protein